MSIIIIIKISRLPAALGWLSCWSPRVICMADIFMTFNRTVNILKDADIKVVTKLSTIFLVKVKEKQPYFTPLSSSVLCF